LPHEQGNVRNKGDLYISLLDYLFNRPTKHPPQHWIGSDFGSTTPRTQGSILVTKLPACFVQFSFPTTRKTLL